MIAYQHADASTHEVLKALWNGAGLGRLPESE